LLIILELVIKIAPEPVLPEFAQRIAFNLFEVEVIFAPEASNTEPPALKVNVESPPVVLLKAEFTFISFIPLVCTKKLFPPKV